MMMMTTTTTTTRHAVILLVGILQDLPSAKQVRTTSLQEQKRVSVSSLPPLHSIPAASELEDKLKQ